MGLVSSIRKQVDRPSWEVLRFAPATSSSTSTSCTGYNSNFHVQHGRYIYYLISSASFWRYDTWTDTYVGLSSPITALTTFTTMRFLQSYGYEGRVLSAATGSVTIPAYFGQSLKGFDIQIVAGTGQGQRRVVSGVADAVVADSGVATAANVATLTDSTKAWTINQWAGYQVRITFGTGVSQVRRILYNSATVLTVQDTSGFAEDTFCDPANAAFNAVAGSQSVYQIESSVVSVDQNWTTTPDSTSKFRIASGAISVMSAASGGVVSNQWYDVLSDTWYTKSWPTLSAPTGTVTDGALEASDEANVTWDRGFATGGSTTTLIDTTKSWTVSQWIGYLVYINYGTAIGQVKKVTANTSNTLTFATGTAPDTTSSYTILGYDGGTATSGGASTITDSGQAWATNRWKNYAVRILTGTGIGQVLPILSNTSTAITVVKPWVTNPDNTSVYVIVPNQDQMNLMCGAVATVFCYGIDDDMSYHGRLNDSGAARIGAVQFGSMKPQALATITKSGTTATATTVNPVKFPSGSTVTISGATGGDAATYNISAVATITGANTFTYTMGGTPGSNAAFTALSTTVLVDSTKNWTTNQFAGYLCHMCNGNTGGVGFPIGQTMVIASNTATTITLTTAVTIPTNGQTRYVITPNTIPGALASGTATGGSQATTTLGDSGASWVVNAYAGRKVKFTGGAGEGQEATIASNTSTVLTFAAQTTAPIAASTTYSILAQSIRGTGIELRHAFGTSDIANKGKYLFIARGGANLGFDRLNLTTDTFEMMATSPQSETLNTGTMVAYDGVDRLYYTKDATQRVYYMDIPTSQIHGAGLFPYIAGAAIIGNRMEIFTTSDGLKFLWLNRHFNLECFRTLLFW